MWTHQHWPRGSRADGGPWIFGCRKLWENVHFVGKFSFRSASFTAPKIFRAPTINHLCSSALEVVFNVMRSINPRFTYLLTYLLRKFAAVGLCWKIATFCGEYFFLPSTPRRLMSRAPPVNPPSQIHTHNRHSVMCLVTSVSFDSSRSVTDCRLLTVTGAWEYVGATRQLKNRGFRKKIGF